MKIPSTKQQAPNNIQGSKGNVLNLGILVIEICL